MKPTLGLHTCVLWGFAVAQPLYDLIGRYPTFLSAHHLTGPQIVILAVLLSVGLPALLWGFEWLVAACHRRTAAVLHQFLAGALLALTVFAAVWRVGGVSSATAGAAGLLIWSALLWGYLKTRVGQSVVTVLVPSIVIFPAVFLFTEPVSKFLNPPAKISKFTQTFSHPPPPIVMVVFDELPTSVLTDGGESIDANRFPNFSKLAAGSYWFRNTTTVDTRTEWALPAILTGRYKEPGRVRAPTAKEYPDNLFTLLSGWYQMRVSEPLTDLCPADVCSRPSHGTTLKAVRRLILDLASVYMHIATPPLWRAKLPPINQAWADFGIFRIDERAADLDKYGRHRQANEFIESIKASPEPTLYFMHSNLPHMPYEYFPSGTIYYRHAIIRGINKHNNLDVWSDDPLAVAEAKQRFVLQVQFVDRIVGDLVGRLRRQNLYDKALIIITADHGVAIRENELRRGITHTNQRDIVGVPLFVKRPGQERGVISDRNVELIDVLPAIVDVIGGISPGFVDGRSPFGGPEKAEKLAFDGWREWQFPADLMVPGNHTRSQWRTDPGKELTAKRLLGQRLTDLNIEQQRTPTADVVNANLYKDVKPQTFVPAHVVGRVSGPADQTLAVALNDRIEAVTRSYRNTADGPAEFSALLPEHAFRRGRNRLVVLRVDAGSTNTPRLVQIY